MDLAFLWVVLAGLAPARSFKRTGVREDCDEKSPRRPPFFGDLHVHTRSSSDSSISSQRNDSWDASPSGSSGSWTGHLDSKSESEFDANLIAIA